MFRPRAGIYLVVGCAIGLLVVSAHAAEPRPGFAPERLFPGARFNAQIPTPEQATGVALGSRPLGHAEVMAYFRQLAEGSPRATLREYARSHESRELVYLAVSDRDTIARLDDFQAEHRQRMDPRGRAAADDARLIENAKAVAWIAYGIHGDELSSVDAAVAVAYWLVAGEDEATRKLREDLVVLIDPMENPDGRERYLAQTRSFAHAVPNPDLEDLSHTSVWPWGRGNHYLFDLNRDWFSLVQPESARSGVIASWEPQLVVDSHEMGANSSYLFTPPRHPFNPHLPPSHHKWWKEFAQAQARALDQRGYDYFTREWNEEFFPGYGSSWAAYRGALGILYEMSRTTGSVVQKRSGGVRTYPQAVEHQVASSIANLQTLSTNRQTMLGDFLEDRRHVLDQARSGDVAAWVLSRSENPRRTDRLVELLRKQGIEVLRSTTTPPAVKGLHGLWTGQAHNDALTGDAWLIPVDQPAGALVRVLLDPHVPMENEFLREQREYLERGWGSRLYETTSWSLLLNYDVDAYWTKDRPSRGWEDLPVVPASGDFQRGRDAIGYFVDGADDNVVPALVEMLERGLTIKVAGRPLRIDGQAYGRGTLWIHRETNDDDLEQHLAQIAETFAIAVQPTSTALAEEGPDLGGSHFHTLKAPRVGIFAGYPISPTDYGAIWHLLDIDMGLRFSALDLGRFAITDLSRYNVLVFPPAFGGANAYASMLDKAGWGRLKSWVNAGGTAIGIGSGAEFLAKYDKENEQANLTQARLRRHALKRYPPVVLGPGALEAQAAGPFRAVGIYTDDQSKVPHRADLAKDGQPHPVYDVAPIIGPGAQPFVRGRDLGVAFDGPPVTLDDWIQPLLAPGAKPTDKHRERADARLRRFGPRGAFLRVELDPHLWLNWGMDDAIPVLARATDTLVAEAPVQVPARFSRLEQLHLGGLLWPEAAARLANTAYSTRESVGRGQVILFLNQPEFRGWTHGTRRWLQNAMLYGPGLGTRWSTPW